jgi:hypothetical protein
MKMAIVEQRYRIHFRVCCLGIASYLGSRAFLTHDKDCV